MGKLNILKILNLTMSEVRKALVQPVNVMFRYLQTKEKVELWLFNDKHVRLHGVIRGFDEHMNIVIDNVLEINFKKDTKQDLGMILLKGDCVSLIRGLNLKAES